MHAHMYCVCMYVHILQFGMSEMESGNNFTLPFKLFIMSWLIHWNSFKIPTLERWKQKKTFFGKWYCCKMQCETLQDTETNGCIQMGQVPALYYAWLTLQAMLDFRVHPSLPFTSVCQSFPLLTSSRSSPASPPDSLLTFWQLRFNNRSFDFDIFKFLLSFSVGFLGLY